MPLFIMIGWDGEGGAALRAEHREAHVAHVKGHFERGLVDYAGPIKDDAGEASIGAIIVYRAVDFEAARRLVDADPYVSGGVFERVTVHPFRQAFPSDP